MVLLVQLIKNKRVAAFFQPEDWISKGILVKAL